MCGLIAVPATFAQEGTVFPPRPWVGQAGEIEQFIRDAEVVGLEEIGTGVTNPMLVELADGGPIQKICFKPLRPGVYKGFYESYNAEIAAYELDKLLELGMVPPTVEKRIERDNGAAIMWLDTARSFKELGGTPRVPQTQRLAVLSNPEMSLKRRKVSRRLTGNRIDGSKQGSWRVPRRGGGRW